MAVFDETAMTRPTKPPSATTGIPSITPSSLPLEMVTVAAKLVGESVVTWATRVPRDPTHGTCRAWFMSRSWAAAVAFSSAFKVAWPNSSRSCWFWATRSE